VPVDFSTRPIPQIDPKLLSDDNSQPPIPAFDGDSQWKSVSGNDLNNSLPAGLGEFLKADANTRTILMQVPAFVYEEYKF
jgi:hypothetical protein